MGNVDELLKKYRLERPEEARIQDCQDHTILIVDDDPSLRRGLAG